MAKSKRNRRAKNRIDGSSQDVSIKSDSSSESAIAIYRSNTFVARTTMFSAELEHAIDVIARERVYRAMLAGLERRLLMAPMTTREVSEGDAQL
jgi:hypothetical protein